MTKQHPMYSEDNDKALKHLNDFLFAEDAELIESAKVELAKLGWSECEILKVAGLYADETDESEV